MGRHGPWLAGVSTMSEGEYRFEPLQRTGLLLGLSAAQLGVVAGAVLVAFASVRALPGARGWAVATVALVAAGGACKQVMGRSPLDWARLGSSFLMRPKRAVVAPPAAGATVPSSNTLPRDALAGGPPRSTPGYRGAPGQKGKTYLGPIEPCLILPSKTFASGVYLGQACVDAGGPVGVLVDERFGTVAALLRARGGPFCLLDRPAKELRQAAWAGALESFSNQLSGLVRLQWCHRALPVRLEAPASEEGTAGESWRCWRHETFLVVVVRGLARRRLGAVAGRHEVPREVAFVLGKEVAGLRAQLHAIGTACDGPLDARGCARAIGASLVAGLERHPRAHPWPLATSERWGEVQADGYWHRVYWVAEWPRSGVGPDFLSPLLVARAQRCFSVVMAPVPPERAARDAESSRTAQLADAKLRAQGGFLETARQRRQAEAVEGREVHLAEGRGAYRFAGYVAVSARAKGDLERSCGELERAAGSARLCLRPLYGQQKEALSWALPFGRGV